MMPFLKKYFIPLVVALLLALLPNMISEEYKQWLSAKIPHFERWGLGLFALTILFGVWWENRSKQPETPENTAKSFEPEIQKWLKKRYQNRLDQKMAGRLPINLRRIDFTQTAAQLSQKRFKEIAPEDVGAELSQFFKTAEGRLLILGAPGAGKTTLLLQLAVELLETEADALPAVVNLATWSKEFNNLDEWLKKILPVELGVSTALAVRLLAESRVVLLFDGLDEIADAEQRAACLRAIDLFVSPARPRWEFAISSRTQEFREAGRFPQVSFPIEVGPLEMAQIERELTRRDPAQPEDRDLLAALQNDRLLREAAETPFYFNCLQLLFGENRRPVFSAFDRDGREREVLDAFLANELGKCSRLESFRWLSFLASRMSGRELVRFELLDLQHNWSKLGKAEYLSAMITRGYVIAVFPNLLLEVLGGTWIWYLAGFKAALKFTVTLFFQLLPFRAMAFMLVSDRKPIISTRERVLFSKISIIGFCKKNKILLLFLTLSPFIFLLSYKEGYFLETFYLCLLMGVSSSTVLFLLHQVISDDVFAQLILIEKPYQRFIFSAKNLHFSILQHWQLRRNLYMKGLLPFRLVTFLNELSNQKTKTRRYTKSPVHLMESDGASWRFRHRLIQEWFAARWREEWEK